MSVQGAYKSSGDTVSYCPSAAKSAGDIVTFVDTGVEMIGMVTADLAASELGSIYVRGVWNLPLASGHGAIEVGTDLYWDVDGNPDESGLTAGTGALTTTSTANVYAGKAVLKTARAITSTTKAAASTDERCDVLINNGAIGSAS